MRRVAQATPATEMESAATRAKSNPTITTAGNDRLFCETDAMVSAGNGVTCSAPEWSL